MATEISTETLAKQVSEKFVHDKRNDGTEFVKLADGAPEWMIDLCREAHGGFLPDDWRYEFIEDAVAQIEDGDEDPEDVEQIYPYTDAQNRWLASNLCRREYCNETVEEFGGDASTIDQMILLGMQREYEEVFHSVRNFLEDLAETLSDFLNPLTP